MTRIERMHEQKILRVLRVEALVAHPQTAVAVDRASAQSAFIRLNPPFLTFPHVRSSAQTSVLDPCSRALAPGQSADPSTSLGMTGVVRRIPEPASKKSSTSTAGHACRE